MAGYMANTLLGLANGKSLAELPAFKWKNHGSMVFIGDYQVGAVEPAWSVSDMKAMVDRSAIEGFKARISG